MPSEAIEKPIDVKTEELVSIITPSFNVQEYIGETIASVLRQTYPHWEMIIVDDASTDQTVTLIKEIMQSDSRIQLCELPKNKGAATARNRAIELANGKYLAFLDADDIWLPFHLAKSIATIKKEKNPLVFASCKRANEKMEFIYKDFIVPKKVSYTDILKTNSIPCLTCVVDVHQLGKEKMPLIQKRQDMGLWLTYLKKIPFAYGIQECHAIYRIRKDSLSRNKTKLIGYQWQFYRKVEGLNPFLSLYYLLCWMYYGYKKYK